MDYAVCSKFTPYIRHCTRSPPPPSRPRQDEVGLHGSGACLGAWAQELRSRRCVRGGGDLDV
jgi:hypothetical protein